MAQKRIQRLPDRCIMRRWRRDIIRPHLKKLFPGGYPTVTDQLKKYNELKKWFDKVCDVALDSDVKIQDFKNVMKARLAAYLNWNDDMVVLEVDGDGSDDDDSTYIINPREAHPRGRPLINRYRGARSNIFRRGGGQGFSDRTGGDNNGGNRGGKRRGRSTRTSTRGGGVGGGRSSGRNSRSSGSGDVETDQLV
ncbi:glycine-rich RNA-binding protein 8-like [Lycium ferocissimum]|uniref:glycine-rich RNA-binding protein 8-like n=1 Tax=Lycium ferocissimum TaxID=112874 RepID=UPI002814F827|nr:glycine-rich RNA-binding protein 8-like [Lycium ferocissimum]